MFVDVKPLDNFSYNCYEGSIASVATAWNCDFEIAYAKGWDFIDLSQVSSATDCYSALGKTFIDVDEILKFSNMQTKDLYELSWEAGINVIKKELLNNKPVLVSIDIAACPWFNVENSDSHAEHGILIIGFDDDFLYCTDVSKRSYKELLSYDNFKKGFLGDITTFLKDDNIHIPLKKSDYIKSVLQSSQRMIGGLDGLNRFDSMRKFTDIFIDLYMITKEEVQSLNDENFYVTKLYIHMVNVMQDRGLYSRLLGIIGEKFSNKFYVEISKTLGDTGHDWYKVLIMLVKAHLAGGDLNILRQICNIIKSNIELEEKIAADIINKEKF